VPILQVTIQALAPLVFSERRPGNQFRSSASYIPGGVLRGALAREMLEAGEKPDPGSAFEALFLQTEAPLFRNAYPASLGLKDATSGYVAARPLPATAWSCKAESGFRPQGHGVYDGLIDRLCAEMLGCRVPYLPRCSHKDHKNAGERVEAFTGFYAGAQAAGYESVSPPTHLTARAALNRQRRVAQEGMLYNPLVIQEVQPQPGGGSLPTVFVGSIVAQENIVALLQHRLAEVSHIGSGVSRGFGRVQITVETCNDAGDPAARMESFNAALTRRRRLWEQLPCRKDFSAGRFFSILLLSDAALREDGGWTPTVRLEPQMIGPELADVTLVRSYASADYRGGWNTAWGLPKDTEVVARMGSIYVYYVPEDLPERDWAGIFRRLEEQGVGMRRQEGLGQVRICDDFHLSIKEGNDE